MRRPAEDGSSGSDESTGSTETAGARGAGEERLTVTTDRWLTERRAGVPDELLPWLEEVDAEGTPDGSPGVRAALACRGLEALRTAMGAPGRVRESAFRLLAADAYLTWSALASLDLPDPEPALEALLRRVAEEDP